MTAKSKRIADFIESLPESRIESSTILLGGTANPLDINYNSGCKNDNKACDVSHNNGKCQNNYENCKGKNYGYCSDKTLQQQNPSTDLC